MPIPYVAEDEELDKPQYPSPPDAETQPTQREIASNPIIPSAPNDAPLLPRTVPAQPIQPGPLSRPAPVAPLLPVPATRDRQQNIVARQARTEQNYQDRLSRFNAGAMYEKQQSAIREQRRQEAATQAAQERTFTAQEREKGVINAEAQNTLRQEKVASERDPDTGFVQPVRDETGRIQFKSGGSPEDKQIASDTELHSAGRDAMGQNVYQSARDIRNTIQDVTANGARLSKLQQDLSNFDKNNPSINETQPGGGWFGSSFGAGPTQTAMALQRQKDDLKKQVKDLTEKGYPEIDPKTGDVSTALKSLSPDTEIGGRYAKARETHKAATAEREAWLKVSPKDGGDIQQLIADRTNDVLAAGKDPAEDPVLSAIEDRRKELGIKAPSPEEQALKADPVYGPAIAKAREQLDNGRAQMAPLETRANKLLSRLEAAVGFQSNPITKDQGDPDARFTLLKTGFVDHLTEPAQIGKAKAIVAVLQPTIAQLRQSREALQPAVTAHAALQSEWQKKFAADNAPDEAQEPSPNSAGPTANPPSEPAPPQPTAGPVNPRDFETKLSPQAEAKFQEWKTKNAPGDSGNDYDFRGAFKADVTPNQDGHWPDTFKKPNHPTFSDQSIYAKARPDLAGRWDRGKFVPPDNWVPQTPADLMSSKFDALSPERRREAIKRIHIPTVNEVGWVPAPLIETFLRYANPTGLLQTAAEKIAPGATPAKIGKGVIEGISEALAGFTTPDNLAMLAVMPETKIAQVLINLGFGAEAIGNLPSQVKAYGATNDPAEKAKIVTGITTSLGLPALGLTHAAFRKSSAKAEGLGPGQAAESIAPKPSPPASSQKLSSSEASRTASADTAHAEIDALQPNERIAPEQIGPTQTALRALVKIAQGQPMEMLTAEEKRAVLAKHEDGLPRVEMVKGPDGAKPVITEAALSRVRAIAPETGKLLPESETAQREAILNPKAAVGVEEPPVAEPKTKTGPTQVPPKNPPEAPPSAPSLPEQKRANLLSKVLQRGLGADEANATEFANKFVSERGADEPLYDQREAVKQAFTESEKTPSTELPREVKVEAKALGLRYDGPMGEGQKTIHTFTDKSGAGIAIKPTATVEELRAKVEAARTGRTQDVSPATKPTARTHVDDSIDAAFEERKSDFKRAGISQITETDNDDFGAFAIHRSVADGTRRLLVNRKVARDWFDKFGPEKAGELIRKGFEEEAKHAAERKVAQDNGTDTASLYREWAGKNPDQEKILADAYGSEWKKFSDDQKSAELSRMILQSRATGKTTEQTHLGPDRAAAVDRALKQFKEPVHLTQRLRQHLLNVLEYLRGIKNPSKAILEHIREVERFENEARGENEPGPTTTTLADTVKYPVTEVPVADLKLSEDVPNFKERADKETGVVEGQALQGDYNRLGTGAITVWERADGSKEVISGRHRLALARESGEKTIPAQIVREAEGFTKEDALTFDAEANIRDGQGSVSDYANYFRNSKISHAEASSRGLLARDKGRKGFAIGRYAGDDLYALYRSGKIAESKAAAIADAGKENRDLQNVGIRAAKEGASADEIRGQMEAAQNAATTNPEQAAQADFFSNTAIGETWKAQGKYVAEQRRELQDIISTRRSIVNKYDAATSTGSIKATRAKAERELASAELALDRWNEWAKHPDLKSQVENPGGATSRSSTGDQTRTIEGARSSDAESRPAPELFSPAETPFNLAGEIEEPAKPPETTTAFGGETLSQQEMFGIQQITELKDPGKSADAAEGIHGDPATAATAIERQLRIIDSDPATKKNFAKEQRQRLNEVVALLRQRAEQGGKENASTEPSATRMGVRSEGREVVEEAPLRQPGPTATEVAPKAKTQRPAAAPPRKLEEVADTVKTDLHRQLVFPEGATSIRVTDDKGRVTVLPIKSLSGMNPLQGAGPWKKIEAGTIAIAAGKRGQFSPIKGAVKLKPEPLSILKMARPRQIQTPDELAADMESSGHSDQEISVLKGRHWIAAEPDYSAINEVFSDQQSGLDYMNTMATRGEELILRQPGKEDRVVKRIPHDFASAHAGEVARYGLQQMTGEPLREALENARKEDRGRIAPIRREEGQAPSASEIAPETTDLSSEREQARAAEEDAFAQQTFGKNYGDLSDEELRLLHESRLHEEPPQKLRAGEKQGDLLSTQTEPFKLIGEKGIDFSARQNEADRAARESEAAATKQEKKQLRLFEKSNENYGSPRELFDEHLPLADVMANGYAKARGIDENAAQQVARGALAKSARSFNQVSDSDIRSAIRFEGKQPKDYAKSSTQVTLPKDDAKPFIDFTKSIPDKEIFTDPNDPTIGREDEPHITALYGITDSSPIETAKAVLANTTGTIEATVGKLSMFKTPKYDVLKADIDSPQLHEMNAALQRAVPFETDYPDYKPHLTIAYLKHGEAKKYVGDNRFEGTPLKFSALDFRSKDGRKFSIDLAAKQAAPDFSTSAKEAIQTELAGMPKLGSAPAESPVGPFSRNAPVQLPRIREMLDTVRNVEPGESSAENRLAYREALDSLPSRMRDVMERLASGDHEAEIAKSLGIAGEAIGRLKDAAIQRVRTQLEQKGITGIDDPGILRMAKPEPEEIPIPTGETPEEKRSMAKTVSRLIPGLNAAKDIKTGIQSLLLPTAQSPEHVAAAVDLGRPLGEMHRRQEVSAFHLRPDWRAFEKLGVHREDVPLAENAGIKFMSDMSQGRKMEPALQKVADKGDENFIERLDHLEAAGAPVEKVRENYFPGMWTEKSRRAFNQAMSEFRAAGKLPENLDMNNAPPELEAAIKARADELHDKGDGSDKDMLPYFSKTPMKGKESFRKQKVFDDIMTAVRFGLRPISNNPIDLIMGKLAEMDKSIMANQAFRTWEKKGQLVAFDNSGRPMREDLRSGFNRDVWEKINDKYGTIWHRNEETGMLEKVGERWATKPVAEIVNNYLSSSLYNNRYFGKLYTGWMASANALNQSQLGIGSGFHAGFTTGEAQVSAGANLIKDIYGVMRGNRSFGDLGRTAIAYPTAFFKTAVTGDKVLNAWRQPDGVIDSRIAQVVRASELAGAGFKLERGLKTEQTSKMMSDWLSGKRVRAAMRSPIAFTELLAKPIMEYLVPRQKAGVFSHLAWRIIEQNPGKAIEELSPEFRDAWNRVDARLGQVRYDRLFINNTAKNVVQALVRAPGWTGGTIAELGGAFKDAGSFLKEWHETGSLPKDVPDRVAYSLSLLVTTAALNGALTYLFTGKQPQGQDYVAFRTGREDEAGNPERFTLPTYMKDIWAYSKSPGETLLHKSHPLLSVFGDLIQNKDYYGIQVRDPEANALKQFLQSGEHVSKSFTPFWIRGAEKASERGAGFVEKALPMIGVMPAPKSMTVTPAQELAYNLQKRRFEGLTKTQGEAEKTKLRSELTKTARSGDTTAVRKAVLEGKISRGEAQNIVARARMTPFQATVHELSLADGLKVFAKADDKEKDELREILRKKNEAAHERGDIPTADYSANRSSLAGPVTPQTARPVLHTKPVIPKRRTSSTNLVREWMAA